MAITRDYLFLEEAEDLSLRLLTDVQFAGFGGISSIAVRIHEL